MENDSVNERHDVLFVAAEVPDVKAAQTCTEYVNCLCREDSVNQKIDDDFLSALALNFLEFFDDINHRLKSANREAV